jgi:hypothetical protein
MPENTGVAIEITSGRVRQIGSEARHNQMNSQEADAFLLVHGKQLEEYLLVAAKEFIVRKLE